MPLDDDWMVNARCRDYPHVEFFPRTGESQVEAKAVCEKCPVQDICLAYAIAHHIQEGIWGGLNRYERRDKIPRYIRSDIERRWFQQHRPAIRKELV